MVCVGCGEVCKGKENEQTMRRKPYPLEKLSASTRARYEYENRNGCKCARCGKPIYPHWKYCREHSLVSILLDMDVTNKKRVPLHKQENDRVWKLLEDEMKAHAKLKEQYARLQENFYTLAQKGITKMIYELSTHPSHKD